MRCKACGRVVPDGSAKCPHCGAYISRGGRAGEEFKWNIQEYPKPKEWEPADVSVDWQSGQLVDRGTGRTYDQSSGSGWSEPEEVKYLFTFEPENEDLQREVDRKVDILAERAPKEPPAAADRGDLFTLPAQMDMKEYNSLLEEDEPEPVERSGWINDYMTGGFGGVVSQPVQSGQPAPEPVYKKAPTAAEFIFGTSIKEEEPLLNWDLAGKPDAVQSVQNQANEAAAAAAAASRQAQEAAAEAEAKKAKEVPPPERAANGKYFVPKMMQEQQYDPFEMRRTWDSVDVPEFLRKGERLVFAASGRDAYEELQAEASRELGPSAGYKADVEEVRAQETFRRLIGVEQQFSSDMDRVVFMSDEEKEQEAKAERRRDEIIDKPQIDFLTIEDEYESYRIENGIPRAESIEEVIGEEAAGTEAAAGEAAEESPREVNVKINSPSGTQYTVKTQEIHMRPDALENSAEAPAKAVQVSVEVNGAGGGSVEVTSGPDGVMKVTATEEDRPSAQETEPVAEPEEDVPFWERKKPVSRMTITDIFGPEARDILNAQDDEEAAADAASDDESADEQATREIPAAGEETAEAAEPETEEAAEAEETAEAEVEDAEAEAVDEPAEPVAVEADESADEPVEIEETAEADAEETAEAMEAAEVDAERSAEADAEEAAEAEETAEAKAEDAEAEAADEPAESVVAEADEAVEEPMDVEETAEPEAEDEEAEAAGESAEPVAAEVIDAAEDEGLEPEEQEFTYTVDEDRLTKEAIRNMSQEELDAAAAEAAAKEAARKAGLEEEKKKTAAAAAAVAAAAEGARSADTAAKTVSGAKQADESKKEKPSAEEQQASAEKKKKQQKKAADKAAKEEEKARKKAEKAAARAAAKEEDDESLSLKIMRVVIIVLVIAVALEFLIFGIRLLAPDSMLGIIFNKVGSGITGASSLIGNFIPRL